MDENMLKLLYAESYGNEVTPEESAIFEEVI